MTARNPGPNGAGGVGELLFLPLGGAGEIGMNLNLYCYEGQWLIVDCGVTFGDDTTPGIEVMTPDPAFIAERREDLAGILLTHAHEDHIGAVPHLWPQLRCPVYATAFTAALLRRKLAEAELLDEVEIIEVEMSGRFNIGPFDIELITLTHSIPEPNAVVLRTPAGTVLHTGDWKLDPTPLVGDSTDIEALRRIGDEGVLALIGDSTNALVEGETGSEVIARDRLRELVGGLTGRVAVACFASNIARVQSIAEAAAAHDRHVALVGRSLWRITEVARETGFLADVAPFVTEHDVGYLPADRILMICTGSQGEHRSALPRIARGDHPNVSLGEGDTVIFSSRVIPGNERAIGRLQNQLISAGVAVIGEQDERVHVSGHPARGDLTRMYQWVRPAIAVPVHGELRHMTAHAELALACQVPVAPVIANGMLMRLAPNGPEVIDTVPVGRLAVDGDRLIPIAGEMQRRRGQMMWNGSAVLTLVLDADGALLAAPKLSAPGVLDEDANDDALRQDIIEDVLRAIGRLSPTRRGDDEIVGEVARRSVRRSFKLARGKKPPTAVHVVRL